VITVTVDTLPFENWINNMGDDQVPYAAARAVNDTITGAKEAVQHGMVARFIIRRNWTLDQIIQSKFAYKSDSGGPFGIMNVGRKADFLDKFEKGGTKIPRSRAHLAVPIAARPDRLGIVPDNLRPKEFGLTGPAGQEKGAHGTFIMPMAGGNEAIMQRTGRGRGPEGRRLLFMLRNSAPTPDPLRFQSTAREAIYELWEYNFAEWFQKALDTAK
jgi:hypothetical protein